MSITVAEEGKQVTIVIPKRILAGCEVRVRKCTKVTVDDDCNWCVAKYSCALFMDSTEFSLKDFACRIVTEIS